MTRPDVTEAPYRPKCDAVLSYCTLDDGHAGPHTAATPAPAAEPSRDDLCPDCGHHLHRPNPGQCQWRDCSCGVGPAPLHTHESINGDLYHCDVDHSSPAPAAEPQEGEPSTEAGRALMEWANNAYPGADQLRIWREHILSIETEARASAPAAEPAVTEALRDEQRYSAALSDALLRLGHHPIGQHQAPNQYDSDSALACPYPQCLAALAASPQSSEPTASPGEDR